VNADIWLGLGVQALVMLIAILGAIYKLSGRIRGVETKLDMFRQLWDEQRKNRDEKVASLEGTIAQAREARKELWEEVRKVQDRLKELEVRAKP
jgi:chromosome segregation ATPase